LCTYASLAKARLLAHLSGCFAFEAMQHAQAGNFLPRRFFPLFGGARKCAFPRPGHFTEHAEKQLAFLQPGCSNGGFPFCGMLLWSAWKEGRLFF
jgi:hypothetical protein